MKKSTFLLLLILGLALWLRSFDLAHLFYFTHDEETIVWRVMPLLRDRSLFLLGGVTPLHFHLGPWFYYFSALILFIGKLNPLSWGVAASILGVITTFAIYFITQKLFNQKAGIVAAFLYATSFLMTAYDRHWWPMSLNPLFSLLTIFSLFKLTQKKYTYAFLLSLVLSLGFHTDPSAWGLLLLSIFTWIKFKLPINQKQILLSLGIFALSFLPLIAFDLNNQGKNILSINQYLIETKAYQGLSFNQFLWTLLYIPKSLSRLLYPGSADLAYSYAYCPNYSLGRIDQASIVFTVLTTVVLLYYLFKNANRTQHWLIKTYFLSLIIGLNIYGNLFSSDLFDHYLTTLFPLFFIILSLIITRLASLPDIELFLLTPLIIINAYFFKNIKTSQSHTNKIDAVSWTISHLKNKPFALDSQSDCFRFSGIRYLFTLQGYEPDLSFVDPNFFWLYKTLPQTKYPDILVVFTDNRQLITEYQNHIIDQQQFGNLEVLIIDNAKQNFTVDF